MPYPTRQVITIHVSEEEQWKLEVALMLLVAGAAPPWPPVIVALLVGLGRAALSTFSLLVRHATAPPTSTFACLPPFLFLTTAPIPHVAGPMHSGRPQESERHVCRRICVGLHRRRRSRQTLIRRQRRAMGDWHHREGERGWLGGAIKDSFEPTRPRHLRYDSATRIGCYLPDDLHCCGF